MTTYWYCEYEEINNNKKKKFSCVAKSDNAFPNLIQMIPKVGEKNISISILIEIDEQNFQKIFAKMSKLN